MSDGEFNWALASEEERAKVLAELRTAAGIIATMSTELTEQLASAGIPYRFVISVDLVPVEGDGQ